MNRDMWQELIATDVHVPAEHVFHIPADVGQFCPIISIVHAPEASILNAPKASALGTLFELSDQYPCYQSLFLKNRRNYCLFTCTDINVSLQGSWKIREMWDYQRKKNKAQITKLRETEIFKLPNKELSIIVLKALSELWENTDKEMKLGKQYMSKMNIVLNWTFALNWTFKDRKYQKESSINFRAEVYKVYKLHWTIQ